MKTHPLILCTVLWLGFSCTPVASERVFPQDQLADGDLAFRCGRGVFSRAVTVAEEDGRYSHVGVLVRDAGKWRVVHAVPGEHEFKADFDRVKAEDLEVFFAPDRAFKGSLVHTGLRDSALVQRLRESALRAARDSVKFDNSYRLDDSTEVYCTEFVWRLYRQAGLDLSEGRRRYMNALHIKGDVLLPEHLYEYSGNQPYFSF